MAMQVEVFSNDHDDVARWILEFESVPRVGEYLALDSGDFLSHYDVIEVWYRQDGAGPMRACIRVRLDD